MAVIASVHLADVGAGTALRLLRRAPRAGSIEGLRHAEVAAAAPLKGSSMPSPALRRVALVAFWEGDDALDRFLLLDHPITARLEDGWHSRLEPLRAFGAWPGLPDDLSASRTTDYDGPALVLTLGRLRLTRAIRFLRTAARAQSSALDAPGLVWGTGLARPPLVATFSLWESTRALSTYAYGQRDPGHPDAIATDRTKPFHLRSAFIRFRPYGIQGRLGGRNPLVEHALAGL